MRLDFQNFVEIIWFKEIAWIYLGLTLLFIIGNLNVLR